MPGPVDYKNMAMGLLGDLAMPVGDVIPLARKNPGYLNLTEGARPRYGGGAMGKVERLKSNDRRFQDSDLSVSSDKSLWYVQAPGRARLGIPKSEMPTEAAARKWALDYYLKTKPQGGGLSDSALLQSPNYTPKPWGY